MKTYEVRYSLDHGGGVRVDAEDAEWVSGVLKFKTDNSVVAVFFNPVYFIEVQKLTSVERAA